MSRFTSRKEARYWKWAAIVVAAIYSTLGLASVLADAVERSGLVEITFAAGLALTLVAVAVLGLQTKPGRLEVGVGIGVVTAYLMVLVRMANPAERTHLFEYGLVAVLIYLALLERRANGRRVPAPALLAIGATAILGWIDEAIQWALPTRHYDLRDVGFNALAGALAVASVLALAWARSRSRHS